MKERQWVKLVVYILLERGGKMLVGKRKGTFGDGYYCVPAGHIEKGETVFECARRELAEETGIKAGKFEFKCVKLMKNFKLDGVWADPYVAFCVEAKNWKGEPKNMEPYKNDEWEWHNTNKLPDPLFPPMKRLLECVNNSSAFID